MALWAQSAPVTVSLSAPVNGRVELMVRNHARTAVSAYVVTVSYTANGTTATRDLIWDSALRLTTPGLEPNEAAVRRVGVPPVNASVALRAVVFGDGRTSGESEWVARIMSQRRFALATIDSVRKILPAAKPEDLEAAHREKLAAAAAPERKSLVDDYYRLATPRHARDLDLLYARLAGAVAPAGN
jgi:hypothetical protein